MKLHRTICRTTPRAAVVATLALLAACGNGPDPAQIGSRQWEGYDVAVEVRPAPPRAGHNEVVVIISGAHHRPIYDALVAVRATADQPWVQAIQDGHVGVYRRAVYFARGRDATLQAQVQVQLQRGDAHGELAFPVTLAAAP